MTPIDQEKIRVQEALGKWDKDHKEREAREDLRKVIELILRKDREEEPI